MGFHHDYVLVGRRDALSRDFATMGEVPEYSVVVPGALPGKPMKNGQIGPSTACAVIVKRVDERTRSKTSINELLRD